MGSGKKRKKTDQPLLRRPKHAVLLEEGSGIGTQQDVAGVAADMCLSTFQVEIVKSSFAIKDAKVILELEGELYACYVLGHRIAVLNAKRSEMVSKCGSIGINYSGLIVEDNGKTYARFRRIA